MPRYIDADKVLQYPLRRDRCDKEHANPHFINGVESVMEYIEYLLEEEPADVHEVRHGRWEEHFDYLGQKSGYYWCPLCKKICESQTDYCPNCGARMMGGETDG